MGLQQDGDVDDEAVLDCDSNSTGNDEQGDFLDEKCMIVLMGLVMRTVVII